MLYKITVCLLGLFVLNARCDEKVSRSYFAPEGITVGEPAWEANDKVVIPVKFSSKITHSAQWVRNVEVNVVKTSIVMTANITKPPKLVKSEYPGSISLNNPAPGDYTLTYRDPDGTDHVIDTVTISPKPLAY